MQNKKEIIQTLVNHSLNNNRLAKPYNGQLYSPQDLEQWNENDLTELLQRWNKYEQQRQSFI